MDNLSGKSVSFQYSLDYANSSNPVSDPCLVYKSRDGYIGRVRDSISDEDIILASCRPKKRAGRKKFKETRHPIYRGVRKRNSDKWVCEVRVQIKQKGIWLGTYPTANMAARAHDVAVLFFKGQTTTLNFADSIWCLLVPISNDPKDIRKAAIEGAEKFRPKADCEMSPVRVEIVESEKENAFDMKGWAMSMAEEPLFSPTPRIDSGFCWDDVNDYMEVSLWNY